MNGVVRGPASRRILFVVHSEYPVGEPRVRRQAEAAVEAGWEATVLALRTRGMPTDEDVSGVRVLRTSVERKRDMSMRGLAWEYGRFWVSAALHCGFRKRYDVVVVANPPDFLAFAALPQRWRGARLLLDVHDLMTDLFGERLGDSPDSRRMRLLRWLERRSWSFADGVLTVHEAYADEIRRRSGGNVSPIVVMNSADPRLFDCLPRTPSDRFVVGYHGSILERYGLLDLVQAFGEVQAGHTQAQLVLLGGGDGIGAVRDAVRHQRFPGAVRMSDEMLPVEQILDEVRSFSVGVVPNRPDGVNRFALSTKLFEYVAMGVPAVSAGLPTIRLHFADDEVLFFQPGNVVDLADKLAWAAEHPSEMEERSARALARYRSEYSWPLQRERFLDSLETAI